MDGLIEPATSPVHAGGTASRKSTTASRAIVENSLLCRGEPIAEDHLADTLEAIWSVRLQTSKSLSHGKSWGRSLDERRKCDDTRYKHKR